MGYEVINQGEETIIKGLDVEVNVRSGPENPGSYYALGHLYTVRGGFVPVKTYVFEVAGSPVAAMDSVKKVIDFFFSVLLDAEWYIKEVPRGSLLFAEEAERLYGKEMMTGCDGAPDIISSSAA